MELLLVLGDVKLVADWFKQTWLCVELNSVLWRGTFYLRSHHSGIKGKRITAILGHIGHPYVPERV